MWDSSVATWGVWLGVIAPSESLSRLTISICPGRDLSLPMLRLVALGAFLVAATLGVTLHGLLAPYRT